MSSANVLSLQFLTKLGKSVTVSVREPDDSLDKEMIIAAMDRIIASGAMSKGSGELTERSNAYMTTTTVSEIDYES